MTPEQTEKPTIAEQLRVAEEDAATFFHDCTALQKRLAEAEGLLKKALSKWESGLSNWELEISDYLNRQKKTKT